MVALITDIDLDGLGCEVIAKQVFENVNVKTTAYATAPQVFAEVLDTNPDTLIIADIWLRDGSDANMAFEKLLGFKGQLLIFDHHVSSEASQHTFWKKHKRIIHLQDHQFVPVAKDANVLYNGVGYCSAKKMAEFFRVNLPMIDEVDKYDNSGTIDGIAGALNILLHESPRERIADILLRPTVYLTNDELETVERIKEQHAEELKAVMTSLRTAIINGYSIAYVEVARVLPVIVESLRKGFDFVVLYNSTKQAYSLRSTVDGCNIVAEYFGGGGHKRAAGFSGQRSFEEILDAFKKIVLPR